MSDETKAFETIKENGLVLGSKKDNSMVAQFEKLIDSIIDAKVQEAIQHMELVSEDRLREYLLNVLSEEVRNELEAQEVPDLYGVRDIVSEEIDNIDWNDRVSESGALDGIVTEDTLESTLDEHRDGGEYVTQEELDAALGELSITRG
tara:strand:+ start:30 stop:473 length:444 start_codon:yes stop_codon:yes gene_type:complete